MPLAATTHGLPWAFVLVYVVGFIAAVGLGLVAVYNSKLPPGMEGAKRPSFIPKLNLGTESDETGTTVETAAEVEAIAKPETGIAAEIEAKES